MGAFRDLTGEKFGELTVISRAENHILPSGKPRTYWNCKCSCGSITKVSTQSLVQNTTVSCGCIGKTKRAEARKQKANEIVGKTFGRLTVVERLPNVVTDSGQIKTKYLCQCECGNYTKVFGSSLKQGRTKSCGCYRTETTKARETIDLTGLRVG